MRAISRGAPSLPLGAAARRAPLPRSCALAQRRRAQPRPVLFGDLKYAPDFTHFDYVDPDAPKGGRIVMQTPQWGLQPEPQHLQHAEQLRAAGRRRRRHGADLRHADGRRDRRTDASTATWRASVEVPTTKRDPLLPRRGARFHDGSPLTAEDVAFSLETLKARATPLPTELPRYRARSPRRTTAHVLVRFAEGHRAAWRSSWPRCRSSPRPGGTAATSRPRTASRRSAPAPTRSASFALGRFIEYERVADYWAPTCRSCAAATISIVIRHDIYRDRAAAFEAFKKGEITFREEFTSRVWATRLQFPGAHGRASRSGGAAGRPPAGARAGSSTRGGRIRRSARREALASAFDFEWTTPTSCSALTSARSPSSRAPAEGGRPAGAAELALLEPLRDELPAGGLRRAVRAAALRRLGPRPQAAAGRRAS